MYHAKKHQLAVAMRQRGFAFVRDTRAGHSLWRHDETGKTITLAKCLPKTALLDVYINKLIRGTY